MLPPKLDAQTRRVVHKLGPPHKLGRLALLHPRHNPHEYVVVGIRRRVRSHPLPNLPRARPTSAVAHTRHAEEAVEVVHFRRGEAHGLGNVVVVARRVCRGDEPVLLAVVGEEFPAAGAEGAEVAGPGRDVVEGGAVEGVGVGDEVEGEVGGGRVVEVVEDGVFVPALVLGE